MDLAVVGLPCAGVEPVEAWLEADGFHLEYLKQPREQLPEFRAEGGLVIGVGAKDEHRFLRGVRAGIYAPSAEGWQAAAAESRELAWAGVWAFTQVVVYNDIPEWMLEASVDGLDDLERLHGLLRRVADGLRDGSLWQCGPRGARYECVTLGRSRPTMPGLQMHHPRSVERRCGVK